MKKNYALTDDKLVGVMKYISFLFSKKN